MSMKRNQRHICPDCGAVPDAKNQLRHDETCPSGRALDDVSAADREWFEAHPGADEYWRRPTPVEVESIMRSMGKEMPDEPYEVVGRVRVRQLAPGVRSRLFGDVYVIPESAIRNLG